MARVIAVDHKLTVLHFLVTQEIHLYIIGAFFYLCSVEIALLIRDSTRDE